jgi:spermidine/putrescine transport system permease protein
MSVATAPPERPAKGRRGAGGSKRTRSSRLDLRAIGSMMLVATPSLYVLALLIAPVVLIALYSVNLATNVFGAPTEFSTTNWHAFLFGADNPFRDRFIRSLLITLVVSVGAVIGAYPLAYFLAFVAGRHRYTILLAILAPFFTSYLLRVIAWQGILNNNGVVNSLLYTLGLREHGHPIDGLIYSNFSVGLVLFYAWVPFVALPIFVVLDNLDRSVIAAASDLGASKLSTFFHVTLPMSLPGVASGFVFVLIPTTGEFIAPLLVGGPESQMFGNSIQTFFGETPNWNYGAVLALALVAVVLVLLLIFGRWLVPDTERKSA